MKQEWINQCLQASKEKADFYSGCRKILRGRTLLFNNIDNSLQLSDAGYTKSKLTLLTKHYLHEESKNAAIFLWQRLRERDKYGSAGFSTYNHFLKTDPDRKSKRASVMGPCIQSVVLTYLDRRTYSIDIFYRTTELFKKFPADLVLLRDVLLTGFNVEGMTLSQLKCHFANVTAHPMYFVTLIPSIKHPLAELDELRESDDYFFSWVVKWTARYLVPENHRGIAKFAQALRVHKDVNERIDKRTMKDLVAYLRENHPGYRNDYEGDNDQAD